jgi:hypothetical protein
MSDKICFPVEAGTTYGTICMRLLAGILLYAMSLLMLPKITRPGKRFAAVGAPVRFLSGVFSDVLSQDVRPGEGFQAVLALTLGHSVGSRRSAQG